MTACATGTCGVPHAGPYPLLVFTLADILTDATLAGVDPYYHAAIDTSLAEVGKTRGDLLADVQRVRARYTSAYTPEPEPETVFP